MKKLIQIFAFILIAQSNLFSQQCLPNGIFFRYQYQLDNFQINNPGCTEILGDVRISGDGINNLDSLYNITTIFGDLAIYQNNTLPTLNGLNNLETINGGLEIGTNKLLKDLEGLNILTTIGDHCSIHDNDSLIDFSGLENLTSINDELYIAFNSNLKTFNGLNNLNTIGTRLAIYENYLLESISSLSNLSHVIEIDILLNTILKSLNGLDNIIAENMEDLSILDNDSLSECEVQSICEYLKEYIGPSDIRYNANGCNHRNEVISACNLLLTPNLFSKPELTISPIPANNEIYIGIHNGYIIDKIRIINVYGQIKTQYNYNGENKLDISNLDHGLYVIEVETKDRKFREKLIVKR